MDPYLPPVEHPRGLGMKLAYFFTKRRFGRLITPVKVHSARLPPAFGLFYAKVARLDGTLTIPSETALLIRAQVARINVCLFCIDVSRWAALSRSMKVAPLDALGEYPTSPLFTESERAALDYATELTKEKNVRPETFARLARHYSEREICEIVWVVASEHLYNLTNLGLNIHSDRLCELPSGKG